MRNTLGVIQIYSGLVFYGIITLCCLPSAVYIIWLSIASNGWQIWLWRVLITIILLSGICYITFLKARSHLRDINAGPTKKDGIITRKWQETHQIELRRIHYIAISGESFKASKVIYDWVSEGDEVSVNHWPHTGVVDKVNIVCRAAKRPYSN